MQVIRIAMVVAGTLAACSTGLAREWVYSDPYAKPSPFIRVEENPQKVSAGHITAPWQGCPAASGNQYSICIESHALTFAVPKGATPGLKWSFSGKKFMAESASEITMLGRSERVIVVTETGEAGPTQYLYSFDHGLLGLRMIQGDKGAFLLINGSCGFGASESCYKAPSAK